jgi:nuclear pore complex protein Nup155
MGQAFMNFMLSKSLSHGLGTPMLTNGPDNRTNFNEATDSYRVSTRTGVHGFSTTAGETGSSGKYNRAPYSGSTQRNGTSTSSLKLTKSARLQDYLLRPMAVPLHHLATHHLEPYGTQVVAINAKGVHTFTIESVLSAFAKAILSAGELVAEDTVVTKFFTSYGYDEGCAMGLALAIGCGPANGTMGQSQTLRNLSIRAVMARGLVPKLEKEVPGVGLSQMSSDRLSDFIDSSSDPLVPAGHLFYESKLYKGLRRLFGRLVRPIWNKPLVVVTEGRSVKSHWSHKSLTTPAKVEILLDDETLSDIRAPLHSLLQLTKEVFKRAIDQVPGVVQRQDSKMDIDNGLSQRIPSLTQAQLYKSHALTGISELSEKDRENLAHLLEEKNIHSLYRLLCRVVQLLNLLQLLRKAESMVELPQIDWGVLHGLTVCQLAKTPEGQDRIEKLLNSLVVASASSPASLSYSAQANKIAQEFADKCYLFYPPASRFAYNGIRFAMEALATAPSNRRDDLIAQASSNLIDAASQWRSATLVSGRLLRSRGTESHQEVVARALQNGSPLAKAAELFVELGAVADVVEICLVTSWNFQNRRPAGHFREAHMDGGFSWERDLYHNKRDSRQSSSASTSGSPGTPESYGASVVEKDAVDTCYAIIFYHLSTLLTSKSQLADQMLSACTSYTDKVFLDALFQFLYDRNRTDVLVRISSADVEKWLQDRNLPDLLWRYYDIQGKKYQSAKVSYDRAISKEVQLSIEERIECLTRASNSVQGARQDTDIPSYDELTRFQTKVDDFLAAARIQHRILQAIESSTDIAGENMREKLVELKGSLLNISSLYDIASSVPLTDLCLVIYHKCQHQDAQAISMLWTNLFGEKLLPMAASSSNALSFLRKLASDVRREQAVEELDGSGLSRNGYQVFEKGEWISDLSNKITIMGQELYGTGADYTFPVDFLLEFLELVRKACPDLHHPSWSLTTLANARVPYLTLIESYKALSSREERYTSDRSGNAGKESLDAQVGLLAFWEANSSGGGDQSHLAKQELDRARATGELQSYIDHLHNKISLTTGADDLTSELKQVEEKLSYLLG